MRDLVEELVAVHGGGQEYFSALDLRVREDKQVKLALEQMAYALFGPVWFTVSGAFGQSFQRQWKGRPVLWLDGSLRNVERIPLLKPEVVQGKHFVFLDDSFFRGRTYRVVRRCIEESGGRVLGAVVAYDGSLEPHKDVYSLYRWRDRVGGSRS